MKAIIKTYLLFMLILMGLNAAALENPSLSERIWIKQHLLKPQTNLIFVLSIKKSMLLPSKEKREQQYYNQYLTLANREILSADFINARRNIDKAYALKPEATEIYISELMYQFYQGLIQINQGSMRSGNRILPVSYDFLLKAEREVPNYEAPKMIRHGLTVMQIFYSTIISSIEQFKQHEAFQFTIDPNFQSAVILSRSYFETSLKDNTYNSYFGQLCLLMLAIVENKATDAERAFYALRSLPSADNDLYRLMAIHDISKTHFSNAIQRMKSSIQFADNSDDRLMLASLYSLKGDHHRALKTLQQFTGKLSVLFLTHQFGYALLSGDFVLATQFYQKLKSYPAFLQSSEFVYYALVIELLNNNESAASQYLNKLSDSEKLFNNAQLFIYHFK